MRSSDQGATMFLSSSLRLVCLSALAAATLGVVPAKSQSAFVEGRVLSSKFCAECHDTGDSSAVSPKALGNAGPAFRDIAKKPVMTKLAIRVFMRSTHPSMPDIILSDGEIDAIGDYITGLK